MTHDQRVALYVRILTSKQVLLTEFNVALIRNAAPNQQALDAANAALLQLGYTK